MKYSIETITNQFNTGFTCQAHKKDAMSKLNRLYDTEKRKLMNAILDTHQDQKNIDEVYWSIPHDLHLWKEHHQTALTEIGCPFDTTTIQHLKTLRDAIKDSQIIPQIKSDTQTKI